MTDTKLPFKTSFVSGFINWDEKMMLMGTKSLRLRPPKVVVATNMYIDLNGHIKPTPFAMPRDGVWYFDGQVFSQKPYRRAAPGEEE